MPSLISYVNLKRIFDIFFSLTGLILLSPFFLFIALLIKIFMPGPVFFYQSRIGKRGKEFRLIKFRSMTYNSLKDDNLFYPGDKSGITKLGRKLRKYKIDELPQMINILKGDMSFVGPRPEVKRWTEIYRDRWELVHKVKPGITDNASIEFVNEEDLLSVSPDPEAEYRNIILPRKLELNIEYVRNHSIMKDITILIRTLKVILSSKQFPNEDTFYKDTTLQK
jgi:lipopolysaccharide/colanic/teichoic acid biosynthesis glycosyltransferase